MFSFFEGIHFVFICACDLVCQRRGSVVYVQTMEATVRLKRDEDDVLRDKNKRVNRPRLL